uniref:DYW domain-containing protein n=1 Tax=Davidia involucrata TaxID=16924 RepID=A0A5B7BXV3_DAVIN
MRSLVQLGTLSAGDSILLARIYAEAKDPQGVAKMRKMIKSQGMKTTPSWSWSWSWIEIDNQIHIFVVDDKSHSDSKEIYHKLEEVVQWASLFGYVRDSMVAIPESTGAECLEIFGSYHSEKLAIAFGLARTPRGTSLRIVKNL